MKKVALALLLLLSGSVAVATDEFADVKKVMADLVKDRQPDSIALSPVAGLYEVVYGAQVLYVSKDGNYLLEGNLLDIKQRRNLTEAKRAEARMRMINQISETTMVIFSPRQIKHTLTVFTDVDCPYCRKMHQDMAELNRRGVKVRYLFYPRTGVDTPSYAKAVAIWCAKDRNTALTQAGHGEQLPLKTCDNPVKQHIAAAQAIEIRGTPLLVLENGDTVQGYNSVKELMDLLEPQPPG